jgi:5-methyltetrahydrofolate--homocysteine methyltransferase
VDKTSSISIHAPEGHLRPRHVRTRDEHLARVLAGEDFLLFDGAMGTQLQAAGLEAGALPELLNLTHPEVVTKVHAAYVAAGSEVVSANTFGANAAKLAGAATVTEIFSAAVACARAAHPRYVAADIGPTGSLLRPLGTMSFDEAYDLFAEQALAADAAGADLFAIETMADLAETKAAVLACKENSDLPILCTMTFGEDGRTFLGTTPEIAAVTLSALGVDALGINCSLGPDDVAPLVRRMLPWATCPVMVQANAGLPHVVDGATTYSVGISDYCAAVAGMLDAGVTIIGGCCGTTPAYIAGEKDLLAGRTPAPRARADAFTATSAQGMLALEPGQVGVIGERINPTGKRRLKEALRSGDHDYIMGEAIAQTTAGAQALDVNAGLPELDEPACLVQLVEQVQGVTALPLQVDSADPLAVEAAVRSYPGKPIINSCNGRAESLATIVPIARHYGCCLVGLTLDETGIPATAEGRLDVARRIVSATDEAGIPRSDVAIDCLTMAVSTDQQAGCETLRSIELVKHEVAGVRCVLGVSNVSFGLPFRELLNATFLTAAFQAGLDLAIMNPTNERLMDAIASWRVLNGEDVGAGHFIEAYAGRTATRTSARTTTASGTGDGGPAADLPPEDLARRLVLEGRREPMAGVVGRLLETMDAMQVIDDVLIPALDEVGERFEKGTFFLPQLMASAEAAKAGFSTIRDHAGAEAAPSKGAIALCTVKGDIHDIGKNIVRMLLENYGYQVYDLGRDVEPQTFVDCVVAHDIRLAGLSALMTTTVPAMADTIALLREQAPACKVMVGGAVLNPEYAKMVGADFYAKDAAESARIAGEVLGQA